MSYISVNPLRQNPILDHKHLLNIVTEAMQDWTQRQKLPLEVNTANGIRNLTENDMIILTGVTRMAINQNHTEVDRALARDLK